MVGLAGWKRRRSALWLGETEVEELYGAVGRDFDVDGIEVAVDELGPD